MFFQKYKILMLEFTNLKKIQGQTTKLWAPILPKCAAVFFGKFQVIAPTFLTLHTEFENGVKVNSQK